MSGGGSAGLHERGVPAIPASRTDRAWISPGAGLTGPRDPPQNGTGPHGPTRFDRRLPVAELSPGRKNRTRRLMQIRRTGALAAAALMMAGDGPLVGRRRPGRPPMVVARRLPGRRQARRPRHRQRRAPQGRRLRRRRVRAGRPQAGRDRGLPPVGQAEVQGDRRGPDPPRTGPRRPGRAADTGRGRGRLAPGRPGPRRSTPRWSSRATGWRTPRPGTTTSPASTSGASWWSSWPGRRPRSRARWPPTCSRPASGPSCSSGSAPSAW